MAQQGGALTLLVNHLINQAADSSADFGTGAAGSSSLSSKGTARRDRLQAELAEHSGAFMLAVGARLSTHVPGLGCAQGARRPEDESSSYGGYGQQRDLGLLAWMVSLTADLLLAGETVHRTGHAGCRQVGGNLCFVALPRPAATGLPELPIAAQCPSEGLGPAPRCTTTLAFLRKENASLASPEIEADRPGGTASLRASASRPAETRAPSA